MIFVEPVSNSHDVVFSESGYTAVAAGGSAGDGYTCAIRTTGEIVCFEDSRPHHTFAMSSPVAGKFTAVSAGDATHSCAIDTDKTVVCWGSDYETGYEVCYQQEGDIICKDSNSFVMEAPREGSFISISSGTDQSCAITSAAEVRCWQPALLTDYYTRLLRQTEAPSGEFVSVASSPNRICAVRSDHQPVCWSAYPDVEFPEPPPGQYRSIVLGSGQQCGVTIDSDLECWGESLYGASNPPRDNFIKVSAYGENACGLTTGSKIRCWGFDYFEHSRLPGGKYIDVAAGANYSCGIRSDSTLVCWRNVRPLAF